MQGYGPGVFVYSVKGRGVQTLWKSCSESLPISAPRPLLNPRAGAAYASVPRPVGLAGSSLGVPPQRGKL